MAIGFPLARVAERYDASESSLKRHVRRHLAPGFRDEANRRRAAAVLAQLEAATLAAQRDVDRFRAARCATARLAGLDPVSPGSRR